ncbi:uncharacterized protein LOC132631209 [Lycium barbarum]|uniref:uncharacterized protein LOC132631209 n=1 Tax=Lycium barbarum TaxID=112863 RepID=UPI00293EF79A|nr:uncharacterized protein LOC132631209 [Lycium barbarum]
MATLLKQISKMEKSLEMLLAINAEEIEDNEPIPEPIPVKTEKKTWSDLVEEEGQSSTKEIKKWYVIYDGDHPGLYNSWGIASSHIHGKNVKHESFKTKEAAQAAFDEYQKKYSTKLIRPVLDTKHSGKNMVVIGKTTHLRDMMKNVFENNEGSTNEALSASLASFCRNWRMIADYREEYSKQGFYPKYGGQGCLRAVFIEDADPTMVYSFFVNGMVDSIYTRSIKVLSQFPHRFQQLVRRYMDNFAKGQVIYLRVRSTYPVFDDSDKANLLVPSRALINMGIAGKSGLPPKDIPIYPEVDGIAMATAYAGLFKALADFGEQPTIRVHYSNGRNIVVYTKNSKPISPEGAIHLVTMEKCFYNFSGILQQIPLDLQRMICQMIRHNRNHLCSFCQENIEQAPRQPSSEEDDFVDINSLHADEAFGEEEAELSHP